MKRTIYREHHGNLIKGTIINLLVKEDGYHLVDLKIYADGSLDCLGSVDMPKLRRLFASGKLCWKMPSNNMLFIPYMGYISTSNHHIRSDPDDFIFKIIEDKILELNSGENKESQCSEEFKEYLMDPNESNFSRLIRTYNQLPSDKKALFEHPLKDPLITLMRTKKHYSKEEREYYLRDYFEGEWLEIN